MVRVLNVMLVGSCNCTLADLRGLRRKKYYLYDDAQVQIQKSWKKKRS